MGSGLRASGALVSIGLVALGCGKTAPEPRSRSAIDAGSAASSPQPVSAALSPLQGTKHARFTLSITTRNDTGVVGKSRRSYRVDVRSVDSAIACVNNRDFAFPPAPAGVGVRVTLHPRNGEGGHLGWCRGVFRGTITYSRGYACPAKGRCRPPKGFQRRATTVARFTFRIRRWLAPPRDLDARVRARPTATGRRDAAHGDRCPRARADVLDRQAPRRPLGQEQQAAPVRQHDTHLVGGRPLGALPAHAQHAATAPRPAGSPDAAAGAGAVPCSARRRRRSASTRPGGAWR